MQLPELDQEEVEAQPLLIWFSEGGWRSDTTVMRDSQVLLYVNRDLSKISMFRCDGSECHDDPFDTPRNGLKQHIFEFCCFREVDRSGRGPVCEQY